MAQGQEYQGAWQLSEFQGAWQQQAQTLEKSVSDTLSMSDAMVLTAEKALSESLALADAAPVLGIGKVFQEEFLLHPAVDFDRQYDAVAGGSSVNDIAGEDFCFSFWINAEHFTTEVDTAIFGKWAGNYGYVCFANYVVSGQEINIEFYLVDLAAGDFFIIASSVALDDGVYHHVAITIDRSHPDNDHCFIYTDGVIDRNVMMADMPASVSNSGNFTLGSNGGAQKLAAALRDFKFLLGGLWTQSEVQFQHLNPYSLDERGGSVTQQWRLDEGSGTTLAGSDGDDLTLSSAAAWISPQETLAKAPVKALADSITFDESFAASPDLIFVDHFTIVDARVFSFEKGLADSFNIADDAAFTFFKSLQDALGVTDALAKGSVLSVSDSLSISDALQTLKIISQAMSDTFNISDAVVLAPSKALADQLNISDGFVLVQGKAFQDTLSISDARPVITLGKVFQDAIDIVEAIAKSLKIGLQIPGLKDIAALLVNPDAESDAWMPYIAIGSSNIEQDEIDDSALYDEKYRKRGEVWVRSNTYFVSATFGLDEPNADDVVIYEIGVFDAASGGTLGRRWVLDTPVTKDNIDEVVVECALTVLLGVAAITNEKTFGGGIAPERLSISDCLSMSPGKAFMDNFSISDSLALGVEKVFVEQLSITDVLPRGLEFQDTLVISDSLSLGVPALPYIQDVMYYNFPGIPKEYVLMLHWEVGNNGISVFDVTDKANPIRMDYHLVDPMPAKVSMLKQLTYPDRTDDIFVTSSEGVHAIRFSTLYPSGDYNEIENMDYQAAWSPIANWIRLDCVANGDTFVYVQTPHEGIKKLYYFLDQLSYSTTPGYCPFDTAVNGDYIIHYMCDPEFEDVQVGNERWVHTCNNFTHPWYSNPDDTFYYHGGLDIQACHDSLFFDDGRLIWKVNRDTWEIQHISVCVATPNGLGRAQAHWVDEPGGHIWACIPYGDSGYRYMKLVDNTVVEYAGLLSLGDTANNGRVMVDTDLFDMNNYVYMWRSGNVAILDDAGNVLSTVPGMHRFFVHDPYLYCGVYRDGSWVLEVYDVGDKSNPVLVGTGA